MSFFAAREFTEMAKKLQMVTGWIGLQVIVMVEFVKSMRRRCAGELWDKAARIGRIIGLLVAVGLVVPCFSPKRGVGSPWRVPSSGFHVEVGVRGSHQRVRK